MNRSDLTNALNGIPSYLAEFALTQDHSYAWNPERLIKGTRVFSSGISQDTYRVGTHSGPRWQIPPSKLKFIGYVKVS